MHGKPATGKQGGVGLRQASTGGRLAGEAEAMRLLHKYGIPHVPEARERDWEGLVRASHRLTAPWVLKIMSADASHKTERGLVKLNLHSERELKQAFEDMRRRAKGLRIDWFVLQEQKKGVEFLMGGTDDPVFGKVLVFGLGGVFVELLKERALRVLPITPKEGRRMMEETKAKSFFEGYRNMQVDEGALQTVLMKTAKMLEREKRIAELDLNPVLADKEKVWVADARIVLK